MRFPRVALFAAIALVACTTKQARRPDTAAPATATLAGAPGSDPAAVRQAIDAINARFGTAAPQGDTATLASFYADDGMLMFPGGPAAKGHDAIAKAFAGMNAMMKVSSLKLQTQDLVTTGDYAIETGTYDLAGQPPKGAKAVHDLGKYVVVWKKQADGSYKILRDISNSDQPPR